MLVFTSRCFCVLFCCFLSDVFTSLCFFVLRARSFDSQSLTCRTLAFSRAVFCGAFLVHPGALPGALLGAPGAPPGAFPGAVLGAFPGAFPYTFFWWSWRFPSIFPGAPGAFPLGFPSLIMVASHLARSSQVRSCGRRPGYGSSQVGSWWPYTWPGSSQI